MPELNVAIPSVGVNKVEQETVKQDPAGKVASGDTVNASAIKNNEVEKEVESKNTTDIQEPLSASEMTETVKEMNSLLGDMNRNLSFSIDEQLGQDVIVVKDSESEEVIRQIPSEELVILRKKMDDVVGILFDTKV